MLSHCTRVKCSIPYSLAQQDCKLILNHIAVNQSSKYILHQLELFNIVLLMLPPPKLHIDHFNLCVYISFVQKNVYKIYQVLSCFLLINKIYYFGFSAEIESAVNSNDENHVMLKYSELKKLVELIQPSQCHHLKDYTIKSFTHWHDVLYIKFKK